MNYYLTATNDGDIFDDDILNVNDNFIGLIGDQYFSDDIFDNGTWKIEKYLAP